MKYKIQTINNIAAAGLKRLPADSFEIANTIDNPDAILVRSQNMHQMEISDSVKAIGRAGAGVNNIPIDKMTAKGVPVLNAPGANANAVKELVIAGMLMAARNLCQGWSYVQGLEGDDDTLNKLVEAGKKQFIGIELPGRTLGVAGLGAIGVEVANAALSLGMEVIGYDPQITVHRAWQLSSGVEQADSMQQLCKRADFLTLHVPLVDKTHNLINADLLGQMRDGVFLLNFARHQVVDEHALEQSLNSGRVRMYVTDFPSNRLKSHPQVLALPHLGASTGEAEENCAVMVAQNIGDFLLNGNIRHSVNFPNVILPRTQGYRLAIVNANVPNMLGQISTCLAGANMNIIDMLNKSRDEIAYTLVDVDSKVTAAMIASLSSIEGVLSVRVL